MESNVIHFPAAAAAARVDDRRQAEHGVGVEAQLLEHKPGVGYFRRDLRQAPTRERAVQIALVVCGELERMHDWLLERGIEPPRWVVAPAEAREKGWAVVG